uniref:TROVE domain-containing protein n=1 Tax=Syphacia muris TaxID=451379 RepID=A0A0N5AN79_9BILA
MPEIEELLFGVKPDEPTPAEYKEKIRSLHELEQLADFIETENEEPYVAPVAEVHGQMIPARSDQICNAAGGYVFKVSDLTRIRRFLILGTTGGTYYASEKELTMDNVKDIVEIILKGKGLVILKEILEISLAGRAPKQDSTIKRMFIGSNFVQQAPTQAYIDYQNGLQLAALHAIPKVCRIPTHLFMFLKYCKLVSSKTGFAENSTGWGRAMRKAISSWYFNIEPQRLAVLVTKYQNREGYTHRDLFRLCHITPKPSFPECHNYWKYHAEYDFLFSFIAQGLSEKKKRKVTEGITVEEGQKKRKVEAGETDSDKVNEVNSKMKDLLSEKAEMMTPAGEQKQQKEEALKKFVPEDERQKNKKAGVLKQIDEKKLNKQQNLTETKTYKFITAFEELKRATDESAVAEMIRKYGFVHEHIPTCLQKSPVVWGALLNNMPMTAMIRNLGKMASIGLLTAAPENKDHVDKIVAQLTNEKAIKDARIHPVSVLLASSVYKSGHGFRGKLTWEPHPEIIRAIETAFLLSFKNVTPTNKRYCLALDVSGSMDCAISGSNLTCAEASAALSMVLLRTEPEVRTVAFSDQLVELSLSRNSSLDNINEAVSKITMGNTDCALPMLWAAENKLKFDVFIVYTDCETWYGNVHPFQALKDYRRIMDVPDAKLIVMGMTARECSIADPTDAGMLDICGFDSAVPELVRDFVLGNI